MLDAHRRSALPSRNPVSALPVSGCVSKPQTCCNHATVPAAGETPPRGSPESRVHEGVAAALNHWAVLEMRSGRVHAVQRSEKQRIDCDLLYELYVDRVPRRNLDSCCGEFCKRSIPQLCLGPNASLAGLLSDQTRARISWSPVLSRLCQTASKRALRLFPVGFAMPWRSAHPRHGRWFHLARGKTVRRPSLLLCGASNVSSGL
jgi:hypothetical protein